VGASFTAAQYNGTQLATTPNLTITVVGNNITIGSITGGSNRGGFTVRVTPTNCGSAAAQDITVNVAN
jgi:hypothetical protein